MIALITTFPSVSAWLTFLVLVASALGAAVLIWKTILKHIVGFFKDGRRAFVSINGYDAVTDPATGEIIQEATPALAKRVRKLEDVVIDLADVASRLTKIESWITNHERNNTKE